MQYILLDIFIKPQEALFLLGLYLKRFVGGSGFIQFLIFSYLSISKNSWEKYHSSQGV
jgi:hypothetical protein